MSQTNTWKDKDQIKVRKEKTYTRFSGKSVLAEILDVVLVNKGLFYTIKKLTLAPGETLRGYLGTEREKLLSAAKYYILIVGIFYFIYFRFTHANYIDEYMDSLSDDDAHDFAMYFQIYFIDQLSVWSAIGIFFFAWMSYLFFRKFNYNYMEHLVVNTYIGAQIGFYKLVTLPLSFLVGAKTYNIVEVIIFQIYYTYAFYYFFRQRFGTTLWKTILVVILGYALFFLFVLSMAALFGIYLGIRESHLESSILN